MRIRLYDIRLSRLPELIGKCQGDIPAIAQFVNTAQRRLLMCKEAGDEGWYGTFAEVAFNNISRANPYITTPREIARIQGLDVCDRPVQMSNQFAEYLDFGNGRFPNRWGRCDNPGLQHVFQRNNAVTFSDLTAPPQFIRVYSTNPVDYTSPVRVLLQGQDANGNTVYTLDNANEVLGVFLPITSPFGQSPMSFNFLTGIQKDVTMGQIQFFQVDPVTGAQSLIHTMEPGETVAGYRRYYLYNLPRYCCPQPGAGPIRITALVKMDLVPVATDTDYLLFHNLEAIIEECQSVRYAGMDDMTAQSLSNLHHVNAVRYLNGELVHYYGKDQAAVQFAPFGSARLERLNLAMI